MTSAAEVQRWGMEEMRRINDQIQGKCGIYDEAAGLWAWCVWNAGHLDVLDIGTAFGASAILAARVKQQYGLGGDVYTIDDYSATGEWESSPAIVLSNLFKTNVEEIVWIPAVAAKDVNFKEGASFGACLIDGGHEDNQPLYDWEKFHGISNWVMFHDTDLPAVRDAIAVAKEDHNYTLAAERNNCAVFRRIYG